MFIESLVGSGVNRPYITGPRRRAGGPEPGRPGARSARAGHTRTARRRPVAITALTLGAGLLAGCTSGSHQAPVGRSTATALAPVAVEVQEAAAKVWPVAAQIWPGTVLKDRQIILGDGRDVRLINVDGVTKLTPAKLAEKKVSIPSSGSSYASWDGHPAVVMNMADPAYAADATASRRSLSATLFSAATNELYHATQQKWEAWKKVADMRGTEYPLAVTPRLYRAMLYNDLLAAYKDPKQRARHLAGAAYWNSKWEKEFPDEAKRAVATDIGEGAAGYFDAVATAVAMGADRGNREEIRKRMAFRPIDGSIEPGQLTLSAEGTALGGVAGLILDETRKGWKQEITRGGQTPVGLVLAGVNPVAEQPSDTIRQSIQGALAKLNSDLIPRLNPLVSAFNDKAHALLLVPMSAADGDLDAEGEYISRAVPYTLLARLNGTFRFADGTLAAKEASMLAGMPDGHAYLIIPIDPTDAKSRVSGNRVELKTDTLTGSFQVTPRKNNGREELVAR